MITFGQIPVSQCDEAFQLTVSDDKRALTLMFSDFQTTVGDKKSTVPISTRLFSVVLPLQGDEKRVEIEFIVQGFIFALEGATATLVCSVNGQTSVADFPGSAEQSYLHKFKFVAEAPSESRVCVFLLLGRDSTNTSTEAQMSVTTIDAEILPRQP
jgi:hypothetical protein